MLSADKLKVIYADRGTLALNDISFTVGRSEFVSLVGPSGCGKSTLLRVLAGLLRPTDGFAALDGTNIEGPSASVGVLLQDFELFPWLTVLENVSFGLRVLGEDTNDKNDVLKLLRAVGLGESSHVWPYELSVGMRQRAMLVRVLAANPEVLLLDEPFGALDALSRTAAQDLLLALWERSKQTVIMTTHDLEEAVRLSDRVIVLSSRPANILADVHIPIQRPRSQEVVFTQQFIKLRAHLHSLLQR